MGWLRDLMAAAAPPVRSYGMLARAALQQPDWPADTRPQPRSLAALFSKLDRRQELEWLLDRPAAQQALARVLTTTRLVVATAIDESVSDRDEDEVRFRLADLRFARPLELTEEALPPGIPGKVLRPAGCQRLFWQAGSGAGCALVGKWLSARGLARYVHARDLHDAFDAVEGPGPFFVEVFGSEVNLELLNKDWPEPVCIAARGVPASDLLERSRFERVVSPLPGSYLAELVHWAEERLPQDKPFDGERCAAWLHEIEVAGILDGLETALGLIGLADELGLSAVQERPLDELAQRFLSVRLSHHPDGSGTAWFKKNIHELLASLIHRSLTDSDAPWDAPRTFDEWLNLVPEEYQRSVDADWVQFAVAGAASPITVRELERALSKLPPGAFRVIRLLQAAKLLVPAPTKGLFVFEPRWLGITLTRSSSRALARASPFEWGEALLRVHAAADVARWVRIGVQEQGAEALIEDLLEIEDDTSPAYVAALELVFRATGLAVLGGAEVAAEALESIWDATLDVLIDTTGMPLPRIDYPISQQDSEPLLRLGTFYVAALAISEQLSEPHGRRHRLLRPWPHSAVPSGLAALLDAIVRSPVEDSAWPDLWFLMARLGATLGPLGTGSSRHAIELPAQLIAEVTEARVSWQTVAGILDEDFTQMHQLAIRQGQSWQTVAAAMWNCWLSASPPVEGCLPSEGPSAAALWSNIPSEVLLDALHSARLELSELPYALFAEAQLLAVIEFAGAERVLPDAFWNALPRSVLERALSSADPSSCALSMLWQRFPDALSNSVEERIAQAPARADRMLEMVPDGLLEQILQRLDELLPALSDPACERVVLGWLHHRLAARAPGWRLCYPLLARLARRTPAADRQ